MEAIQFMEWAADDTEGTADDIPPNLKDILTEAKLRDACWPRAAAWCKVNECNDADDLIGHELLVEDLIKACWEGRTPPLVPALKIRQALRIAKEVPSTSTPQTPQPPPAQPPPAQKAVRRTSGQRTSGQRKAVQPPTVSQTEQQSEAGTSSSFEDVPPSIIPATRGLGSYNAIEIRPSSGPAAKGGTWEIVLQCIGCVRRRFDHSITIDKVQHINIGASTPAQIYIPLPSFTQLYPAGHPVASRPMSNIRPAQELFSFVDHQARYGKADKVRRHPPEEAGGAPPPRATSLHDAPREEDAPTSRRADSSLVPTG